MSSSSSSSSAKGDGAGKAAGSASSSSSAASPGSPGSSMFSDSENDVQKKDAVATGPQSSAASAQPSSASAQPSAVAARPSTPSAQPGTTRAQPGTASAQPSTASASAEQKGKRRKMPDVAQEKPQAKKKKPPAKATAPPAKQESADVFVLNLEALQGSWRHSSPNLGNFVVRGDTARFANGISFRVVARADGLLDMVGWVASREQSTAEEIVWSKNGVECKWYFEDEADNLEGDAGINTRNILNGKRRRAKVDYKLLARQLKEEEQHGGVANLDDGSDQSDDFAEAQEAPLSPSEQAKLNSKHVAEVTQKFRQWMLSTRTSRHEELLQRRGRLSTTLPIQVAPSGQALLAKALRGYSVQIAHRAQGVVLSVDASARSLFQERHPDLWGEPVPAAAVPESRAAAKDSVAAAADVPDTPAPTPMGARRRRLRRAVTASDGSGDENNPPSRPEVATLGAQGAPAPETPKLFAAAEEQTASADQVPAAPSAAADTLTAPPAAPAASVAAPSDVDNDQQHEAEEEDKAEEETTNNDESQGIADVVEATSEGCSVSAVAPEAPPPADSAGADDLERPARSIAEVRALLEARPPPEEVQELLDFLAGQSVDASVLTQTKIGLTVNKLKQDYQDAKLKATATELVARWRQVWQKQQQLQLQA